MSVNEITHEITCKFQEAMKIVFEANWVLLFLMILEE